MEQLEYIRRYDSKKDRERFDSQLNYSHSLSDFELELAGHISKINNTEVVHGRRKSVDCSFENILFTVPRNENLEGQRFLNISKNDLEFLEKNYEIKMKKESLFNFHHKTEDYLSELKESRKYRKFLEKNKDIKVSQEIDRDKIRQCYKGWREWVLQRGREPHNSLEEIYKVLDGIEKHNRKFVSVEVDGKMVAFSIGCQYSMYIEPKCIAIYAVSLPMPRNASLFVKVKRAELFGTEEFIDGAYSIGKKNTVCRHKFELSAPYKVEPEYSVIVGDKIKS